MSACKITAEIDSVSAKFLIDTGAELSLLDKQIFCRHRAVLVVVMAEIVRCAGGNLDTVVKVTVPLKIGGNTLLQGVVVAL